MKETKVHVLFTGLVAKDMVSGGDQLILDLAPRLPDNIKLVVVTPEFSANLWKGIGNKNIEFRFIKTPFDLKDNPLMVFIAYIMRSWKVYRLLRKEDVSIIYSCSDVAYADIWPAFFLAGGKKLKWITRIYHVLLPPSKRQGNYWLNLSAYKFQQLSFWMMKKRSNPILALNDKLLDEVLSLGFPKDKMGVLGAGVDFAKISSFKKTRDYDFTVAVLGRIAPVKGVFDMVKIWEKVHQHNPKWKLVWIGGGPNHHKDKVVSMIKEKGLESSFQLPGFLDKNEVYNILKSSKLFLCPDHENGWGLAVCEAMSAGLPVVSYDIDIFGSVYKKGFRSVPLFDIDRFANQIIEVLENDNLRKTLANDALDQAREFDHQKVVSDLLRFIN